jgi:hypothetical protein
MISARLKRRALTAVVSCLPRAAARRAYHWIRGRAAARRLRSADVAFVSPAKAGRTWLRVMLSRVYQQRYGLPPNLLINQDNMKRMDGRIPACFLTHDNHIGHYLGSFDPAVCYSGKKVVLLVREPRDGAVSMFFQWTYRMDPLKKMMSTWEKQNSSMFDFVCNNSIHRRIDFLNRWAAALPKMPDVLVVRYEDLRSDTAAWLTKILAFIGTPASEAEVMDAVAYASFEQMRAREAANDQESLRSLRPGQRENPESFKTRRGKVGGYREYFTSDELAQIDGIVATKLLPGLGYTDDEAPRIPSGGNVVSGRPKPLSKAVR